MANHRCRRPLLLTTSALCFVLSDAWQIHPSRQLSRNRYRFDRPRRWTSRQPYSSIILPALKHIRTETDPSNTQIHRTLQLSSDDHISDNRFIDGDDRCEDDDHDDDSSLSKMPRAKFKKKAYLLLNDVSSRIHHGDPKAAHKAKEMVERLEYLLGLMEKPDSSLSTLTRAYNLWIHAIAKSRVGGSRTTGSSRKRSVGSEAEALLRNMQQKSVKPNLISYTSVMDAYAHDARHDKDAPHHAERLLFELLQAVDESSSLYNQNVEITSVVADTVINAWSQQGTWEGAKRALEILKRLELMTASSSCRPSIHSYTAVLHGLATCRGGKEAAETAEELLYRLLQKRDDGSNLQPDTVVFNAAIHCWANSNDASSGTRAMHLLSEMKNYNCQPDIVSYNTALSAWSHSGHAHAGPQVEKLLKEMITSHRENPDSVPTPDTVSYNNVLHAWSKSELDGAASRAEKVLRYMIQVKNDNIAPDAYSFTSVLDALAKSKEKDKVARAQSILFELFDLRASRGKHCIQLTQVPFNAVLNAAAFSAMGSSEQERRAALHIAVQTFKKMSAERVEPDAVSYGNLMKCFVNLMPAGKSRIDMATRIFDRCCEQGCVGDLMWSEAKKAIPLSLLSEKTKPKKPLDKVRAVDLPMKWRRNVGRFSNVSAHARAKQQEEDARKVQRQPRGAIAEVSYQSGRDL